MLTKNFNLLVLTNIVLGMPMPMLIVLGALAGASLAPLPSLVTAAISVQMLAGIVVASPLSLFMSAVGRKRGFLCVALLTGAGGVLGSLAMSMGSFGLLCVSHFMLGAALVGVSFIRFAASESVPEQYKASAVSLVLASGLVAALLGPTVFDVTKDAWVGFEYAGAYLAIGGLGMLGCLPVLFMSARLEESVTDDVSAPLSKARSLRQILTEPKVVIAISVAAISQAVMLMLMVPTPLAMIDTGHFTGHASDVIRWHVVAMFAPGLITGLLISRWGVMSVISVGIGMLAVSAIIAQAGIGLGNFYLSLIMLGVGWNFSFIGGTHLLQQSIAENERGPTQGFNDTVLAISGSIASIVAGALYISIGWNYVAYAAIGLLLLGVAMTVPRFLK